MKGIFFWALFYITIVIEILKGINHVWCIAQHGLSEGESRVTLGV